MSRPRLNKPQRELIQLAFEGFHHTGIWPAIAPLQHELERRRSHINVRVAGETLHPSFGRLNWSNEPSLSLTIRGVRACSGSDGEQRDFVAIVRLAYSRYLEAEKPPAQLHDSDVAGIGIQGTAAIAAMTLIDAFGFVTAGGSGSYDETWSRWVGDSIVNFRNAATLNQILLVADRLFAPATPRSQHPSLALDWAAPSEGWAAIEKRLANLRDRFESGTSLDDWQDVGRRARELLVDVANRVFTNDMTPPGEPIPGAKDSKRRLELYAQSRLRQSWSDDFNAFVIGTARLANAVTHSTSIGRIEAFAATQALILLVRMLELVQVSPTARRTPKPVAARRRERRDPRRDAPNS